MTAGWDWTSFGAPENSIFISGAGRVQQMSFNEFYQLDKVASGKAGDRSRRWTT